MKILSSILTLLFSIQTLYTYSQTLNDKELLYITERISNKKIIGLGEAEHFYQGFYRTKLEIVKHLIQNEAINTIALEGSLNITNILNDYIKVGTEQNIPELLKALNEPYALQNAGLFNSIEILELVNWLREYNFNNEAKIRLIGIDFQNYSYPLETLEKYATEEQTKQIADTKSLLDKSMHSIIDSNIMIITSPEWLNTFNKARTNINQLKATLQNTSTKDLFKELEQFTDLWVNPNFPRDSMMYDNLLNQIKDNSKVLLWAHNFHIENDQQFKGPKKLGVYLKEKYADQYYIIGISDQITQERLKVFTPIPNSKLPKYDVIIYTPKGDKCEIIN